jgi:hypothetical protein
MPPNFGAVTLPALDLNVFFSNLGKCSPDPFDPKANPIHSGCQHNSDKLDHIGPMRLLG